jgi:hypothetical protein
MLAIPNYARMNRQGPPHAYPDDATAFGGGSTGDASRLSVESKVWI